VVARLHERGCRDVFVPRSAEYDLTRPDAVRSLLHASRPRLVIHLAAVVGGIGANRANPGRFLYENLAMGLHLMEEARLAGVEKLVGVGTVCEYPKHTAVPFREDALWDGYPEETNAPYGLAKRMLLVQGQAYRDQYGFNAIHLLPVNLYGPEDNFDPRTGHVIPALIRKCVEGRDRGDAAITVWGDGSASREFLYVDDAAEGIVLAAERYDGREPINLGTGVETTIHNLVRTIAELTRFEGRVLYDTSMPNGQPRRCLDTSRAERELGFLPTVDLREGLARTIRRYERARLTTSAVAASSD
jgi:GDP-L-fucose synthase